MSFLLIENLIFWTDQADKERASQVERLLWLDPFESLEVL